MVPSDDSRLPEWSNIAEAQLQSKEHRDLLDIIDQLRSQGISQYVDLPQIIVCGDQSAGKSSVLEAISGLSFPTKDSLCTRFATELILRRSSVSAIDISIVPGAERSEQEKNTLRAFAVSVSRDNPGLEQVVEKAREEMGLSSPGSNRDFSTDVLRVELSGPQQPHLTMVDLPGLFEAANREQSDDDAEMVKSLVLSYMESPRSIILAVVSAKSDFSLQSVTKHARRVDPEGTRTLGLITKPDTLGEGSDSEHAYLELAQNKDVRFRLGWHVLRNRDFVTKSVSAADRDRIESKFFSQGVWTSLNSAHAGISALKPRLSHVLRDQILTQLPSVLAHVEAGINDCKSRLTKLGAPRQTLQEQQQYLLHVSYSFHTHIKAAIGGMYNDPFFGPANTEEGYRKRLRAVAQNTLLSFADEMQKKGHSVIIVEDNDQHDDECLNEYENGQSKMSRSHYADKVKDLLIRTRGCELPGTYNPLVVGELFIEQCKPWESLVRRFTSDVLDAAHFAVSSALHYAADENTAVSLLHEVINPKLYDLRQVLEKKIAEVLEPHKSRHPITYNHYLTENIQRAQAQRLRRQLKGVLQKNFGQELPQGERLYELDVNELLSQLVETTEADMDRYASYAAIDVMEAYYKVCPVAACGYACATLTNSMKVALKKVIDDISVLAVEECLIQQLPTLFMPDTVFNMDSDTVRETAAESDESASERERSTGRLYILETGLRNLSRLSSRPKKLREYFTSMNYFASDIDSN